MSFAREGASHRTYLDGGGYASICACGGYTGPGWSSVTPGALADVESPVERLEREWCDMVTPGELASFLGVHHATVTGWAKRGWLPMRQYMGKREYPVRAIPRLLWCIRRYLEEQSVGPEEAARLRGVYERSAYLLGE